VYTTLPLDRKVRLLDRLGVGRYTMWPEPKILMFAFLGV